jgi:hypothetical protein
MIDQPVYLSPAVIDIVTMAQGIFEERLCASMLIDPAAVEEILKGWHPEVSTAAKKLWVLIDQGHQYNLLETAIKAGLLWNITYWLGEPFINTAEESAKANLWSWRCCKAGRMGLQAIASDPTIGEIMERSRYGKQR